MPITDKLYAINIRKYLALGDDHEAGESALIQLLSGFSCPKNPDVEHFLKKNAIEFTKKNQSVTYLVFSCICASFSFKEVLVPFSAAFCGSSLL